MKVRNGRELTPRERDILQGLWTGLSNKEIAASYGISHRTIQQHRQNMMRKWRVDNIATLLELGVVRGVLKPHAVSVDKIQTPRGGTNEGSQIYATG